jgi:hypothetical protein
MYLLYKVIILYKNIEIKENFVSVKKKFDALQKEFLKEWGEYLKLHAELDLYRGKDIGESAGEVNRILMGIQKTFSDMYPLMQFVEKNHALFVKEIYQYQKFIDDIKKAGATEEKEAIS